MRKAAKGPLLGVVCAALAVLGGMGPAQALATEPYRVISAPITPPPPKSQVLELQNPCGIAPIGPSFYTTSYYDNTVERIDLVPKLDFANLLSQVDLIDGPCGLALDGLGRIYVNNYHRNVERYSRTGGSLQTPTVIDSSHPTGVAVNTATNDVYVTARTYVAGYSSSGAPLMDGGEPLRIGEGSLGDGYGLAISSYPGTAGRIYVPDHSDETVKVYDPAVDLDDPVQVITGPPGGFGLLRDSATAIDNVSGEIYVSDTIQYPQYTERPEAVIRVFGPDGSYKGRLKYSVVDGEPVGLAVDNTTYVEPETLAPTQGRVYVTSGNTIRPTFYIYPPGAATSESGPAAFSLAMRTDGDGEGAIESAASLIHCEGTCEEEVPAASQLTLSADPEPGSRFVGWSGGDCSGTDPCAVQMSQARSVSAEFDALEASGPATDASAPSAGGASPSSALPRPAASTSVVAQKGNLRVAVSGKMAPQRLPRKGAAPISVSVGGQISTTDRTLPPQLKTMRIELNSHGRIDATGLPVCNYDRIQPGSSSRALAACRSAMVGKGSFTANITLAGQEPYPTQGRLLVFNGRQGGKPVLFGHIFSARPFATSFVIVFKVQQLGKGTYGTALHAPLPKAMEAWGRLTGLDMTLSRRYSHRGKSRSYISAGCPAPKGFRSAVFPLARTSFSFEDGKKLSSVLTSTCTARG